MTRINGTKLAIAGFTCKKGKVSAQEVDLSAHQGQVVRVYLDDNLRLVINPQHDCYWQLAEMLVPYASIDEINGERVTLPLDLTNIDITLFNLPN